MENSTKGNYWTFLVFEDNIKKNPRWINKLLDTHLRFVVSPYHDKDLWSEEDIVKHPDRDIIVGQHKTPHYHVMVHCDANSTFKTMKDITTSLGLPIPFKVDAPKGLYMYFVHLNRPEKHQYDQHDIKHYNGSTPEDYLMELSKYEKSKIIMDLIEFMRAKRYIRMSDFLFDVVDNFNDPNYEYVAQHNMVIFKEVLKDNLSDARTSIMAEARKAV